MSAQDILNKMKNAIAALEGEQEDEFDTVADSMSLLNDAAAFLTLMYEPHKLRKLKNNDDPAFDRFASKLKIALKSELDYLDSISSLFIADSSDNDAISRKIISYQQEITEILEKQEKVINIEYQSLLVEFGSTKQIEEYYNVLLEGINKPYYGQNGRS